MKVIPKIKVKNMQYMEQMTSIADKKRNGLWCSTGSKNAYRVAFAKGQGGSVGEETWNRTGHQHECCKSKVAWRHRTECPKLKLTEDADK